MSPPVQGPPHCQYYPVGRGGNATCNEDRNSNSAAIAYPYPRPCVSFQTSAVLCAGGCALLALSSLLAIVAILLPGGACERRVCTLAGYMQTAAVFIMASGLLVYPFGFNSATVKRFCENSDIYYAGDCQIGWGYMLAIVGVMLSVFLPFFAKYAPKEHISPTPIPTIL
ncbi:PREDICTED: transmembrane protein 211 [Aptenodytes forsteri]|uniref:transmembrane protein 211 n=1 Tax=Aptenodytes forsteri TaxID=9233 RepID=UPI000905649E|nr:PREDICTED: transmembrane protein 211 [Aptenodytes forsteri]